MNAIMGGQVDAAVRATAADYLHLAKKKMTHPHKRKVIVAVFAYALRAALDELSPDERAEWLGLALAEVRR